MSGFFTPFFFASFSLTIVLTPLIIRLARRVNFLDQPGPRKIHTTPMPYGGGIAVAVTVLLGTLWASRFSPLAAASVGTKTFNWPVYAAGSLVILVLGLVDDRRRLSARTKLLVQTLVAIGVAIAGERLRLFDVPAPLSIAVTVLWILAVTNAFNLLDHMDGLSSGVALLAGASFLVVALQTGQGFIAAMIIPLLGACAGFLLFNFPPAKIFLGDAGSLFIGFWMACLTISFTFYDAHYRLYTYFVPLAVLAVPLFDTSSVLVIRLLRRKPLFEGDTNHLAHRLTALGLSRRGAVLTVYALTLATGISAVLLYFVTERGALLILVQVLLTFGIITLLEAAGRRHDG
ncbi:MAG TPA: MraY family glycosyltransferase [Planctomycetota bacterium]|jgi:UDP-GlcNAc:undecaprenyl-phosphate GlcNAc-1-phosphate transferase|nr:MraY family glycosyltransferase [Planctomycetota bacterium]